MRVPLGTLSKALNIRRPPRYLSRKLPRASRMPYRKSYSRPLVRSLYRRRSYARRRY